MLECMAESASFREAKKKFYMHAHVRAQQVRDQSFTVSARESESSYTRGSAKVWEHQMSEKRNFVGARQFLLPKNGR